MKRNTGEYFENLKTAFDNIAAKDRNDRAYTLNEAVEYTVNLVLKQAEAGGKLLFIGNGASACIASHMASDFWKNAQVKAIAFNDIALLTSVSNDIGYEYVFEKPIEMFADAGDILFAVSSSGSSENIIKGVKAACKKKCYVITLSGFKENNPLRSLGHMNYYVPLNSYGPVEVLHHSICHCVLDSIIYEKTVNK